MDKAKRFEKWRVGCGAIAAALFVVAAWCRFSLPQTPLIDTDYGYLWPVLSKLAGEAFARFQGVNFIYPGAVLGLVRLTGDFRAVTIAQHLLGLAAGGLFWLAWRRLGLFLPQSERGARIHLIVGLMGLAIYLLANNPIWLETRLRPDAVCMFFEMLCSWLALEALVAAHLCARPRRAWGLALGASLSAVLLAALKPSFLLSAGLIVALLSVLVARLRGLWIKKAGFAVSLGAVVFAIAARQSALTHDDENTKLFLPRTLFLFQAPIILSQIDRDLAAGLVPAAVRGELVILTADLQRDMQEGHRLNPNHYPVLGYDADYLQVRNESWFWRWRRRMGAEKFPQFLHYWYWRSLREQPWAFARKIARQVGVFYRWDCPAFGTHRPLPVAYATSQPAVTAPTTARLLGLSPAGRSLAAQLERLRAYKSADRGLGPINRAQKYAGWSFLAVLLLSLVLSPWLVRAGLGRALALLVVLYSLVAGNVLSIAAIHSMEISRYSEVLFLIALLAHLLALRCWLASWEARPVDRRLIVRPKSGMVRDV